MEKQDYINLYKSCFSDGDNFSEILFNKEFQNLHSLVIGKNVVSLLFAIDVSVNNFKGKYIFAACTDEKYRRKGYMSTLLKNTAEEYKSDYDFLILFPSNEKNALFYSKNGFKAVNNFSNSVFGRTDFDGEVITVTSTKDYLDIRDKFIMKNNVKFNDDYAELILSCGTVITDSLLNPTFLVTGDNDKITECLGSKNGITAYMNIINKNQVTVRVSGNEKYCMYLPLKEDVNFDEIFFGTVLD